MTPREEAAFRLGIAHAADQARIAAITLEIRPDAMQMRQRAAIEALRGLADGLAGGRSEVGDVATSPMAVRESKNVPTSSLADHREGGVPAPPTPDRPFDAAARQPDEALGSTTGGL